MLSKALSAPRACCSVNTANRISIFLRHVHLFTLKYPAITAALPELSSLLQSSLLPFPNTYTNLLNN